MWLSIDVDSKTRNDRQTICTLGGFGLQESLIMPEGLPLHVAWVKYVGEC